MAVEVSVVVPVYNPGRFLVDCADSLLAQSVPAGRRELIFVDDGSTDGSAELLDSLAVRHPDVQVIHQANSGWAGKPRNVGLDLASGEYVFFCDHDDLLWPEALERMLAMARRTGADVLVPKMVSHGRPVPRRVFRRNIDDANLVTDDVMSALTPHKLFRRSFLVENSLRFPEGKRRLEDHVFVIEAYLRASVISVLADYPCYVRVRREDDGNAALQRWEATYYYTFVAEVIDVIEANTEPGELRDALLLRPYRKEMVDKLTGTGWRRWDRALRREIFEQVRMLMTTRFPRDFDERLPIVRRAHARALLEDRLGQLRTVARSSADTAARAEVHRLAWSSGRWVADLEAEVTFGDGSPIRLFPQARGTWTVDANLIPRGLAAPQYAREDIVAAEIDVLLFDRVSKVEWYLPTVLRPDIVPVDGDRAGAHRLVFRGEVPVDPTTAAGGRPLPPGKWVLRLRADVMGLNRNCRLDYAPVEGSPPLAPELFDAGLLVTPFLLVGTQNLGFEVTRLATDALPSIGAAGSTTKGEIRKLHLLGDADHRRSPSSSYPRRVRERAVGLASKARHDNGRHAARAERSRRG
ncbi:MAG TPA: glycosyltransferase [Mycobacteriales bacterium]|nr:glycosyltransferase [Mycobacteriales bacterium]